MVPHRSTNQARRCLTSLSRREAVLSSLYGRSYQQIAYQTYIYRTHTVTYYLIISFITNVLPYRNNQSTFHAKPNTTHTHIYLPTYVHIETHTNATFIQDTADKQQYHTFILTKNKQINQNIYQ